jgi:hypothetical protein
MAAMSMPTIAAPSYRGYRFPAAIISHGVWYDWNSIGDAVD